MNEKEIYSEAIKKFGLDSQLDKAIEEMAELIVDIQHVFCGRSPIELLAEEIADVEIMLGQLRLIIDSDLVDKFKEKKLKRLKKRIEE